MNAGNDASAQPGGSEATDEDVRAPALPRADSPAALRRIEPSRKAGAKDRLALRRFHFGESGASAPAGDPRAGSLAGLRPPWLPTGAAPPVGELWPVGVLCRAAAGRSAEAQQRWLDEVTPRAEALRAAAGAATGEVPEGKPRPAKKVGESAADHLEHALGAMAGRYLDAAALAARLGKARHQRAPSLESAERRRRALAVLEAGVSARQGSVPRARIWCEPRLAEELGLASRGAGAREGASKPSPVGDFDLFVDDDPCFAAGAFFDEEARHLSAVLAASRVARLELEGVYDPEVHDTALAAFDWQAFRPAELALLAPILVLVSADEVAARGLASLSRLLLSGRPVQVLLLIDPASSPGAPAEAAPAPKTTGPVSEEDNVEGLMANESMARPGFRLEPGYLGLSHRVAFVQQGSAADGETLEAGFDRSLRAIRTALFVIARDRVGASPDIATAALFGRAHPLFVFDPDEGSSLDLSGNPASDVDWPDRAPESQALRFPFTFCDYALLEGSFSSDFLLVEDALDDDFLLPVGEWLELSPDESFRALPFTWVVDEEAVLHRLLISRKLALQCRDRLDFWRALQRLSGARPHPADRQSKASLDEAAGTEEVGIEPGAGPEALSKEERKRVAAVVVGRLVRGLMGG